MLHLHALCGDDVVQHVKRELSLVSWHHVACLQDPPELEIVQLLRESSGVVAFEKQLTNREQLRLKPIFHT